MTKEQTPPLVSDELALQCKNEADEMYPPHLAPDEVIGDHFMLVRYAVANALYNDRQKTREVVQALVDALDRLSKEMDCDDWGEIDVNGDITRPLAHDIIAMPGGCPKCKTDEVIDLAKSQLQIEPTKP